MLTPLLGEWIPQSSSVLAQKLKSCLRRYATELYWIDSQVVLVGPGSRSNCETSYLRKLIALHRGTPRQFVAALSRPPHKSMRAVAVERRRPQIESTPKAAPAPS